MTWMEELIFNENVLNGFDLPEPEDGQDLAAYKRLAELSVSVHGLPPEMKGCLSTSWRKTKSRHICRSDSASGYDRRQDTSYGGFNNGEGVYPADREIFGGSALY